MQHSPISTSSFKEIVHAAFDLYRKRQTTKLIDSALLQQPLFRLYLLPEEVDTLDLRARFLQSMLRWTIEHLHPGGPPDYSTDDWRIYTILHDYYHNRQPIERVANKLGISISAVYYWLDPALAMASSVLEALFQQTTPIAEIRYYLLAERYRLYATPEEQRLIELLAVVDSFVRFADLLRLPGQALWRQLLGKEGERFEQVVSALQPEEVWLDCLARLLGKGWLQLEETTELQGSVRLFPALRDALLPILPVTIRWQTDVIAATYQLAQHEPSLAVQHLFWANEMEAAVHLLLRQQQWFLEYGKPSHHEALFQQIHPENLPTSLWLRFQGFVAEWQAKTAQRIQVLQPQDHFTVQFTTIRQIDSTPLLVTRQSDYKQMIRWRQVSEYLQEFPEVTCKTYATLTQISVRQAGRDLAHWVVEKRLVQVGQARAARYKLAV